MLPSLSKEQKTEIIAPIRRYFAENLDGELSDTQAGFLLEYFMNEIGPFAYNQGVEDARKFFTTMAEDLPGTCFHEAMTYWKTQKGVARTVRRKPGSQTRSATHRPHLTFSASNEFRRFRPQ